MWPNQILVSLSANGVAVIWLQSSPFKKIIAQQFKATTHDADQHGSLAHNAIQDLESILTSMQVPAKAKLIVTLASDFVYYLALPAQQLSLRSAEKKAYAQAVCRELYGEMANEWILKCDDAPPHQAAMIAAIERTLYESLVALAARHQLKLLSVQPYLMTAQNRLQNQIAKTSGYLAILEQGKLLLISLMQGQCQNIKTFSVSANWHHELIPIISRDALLLGHEQGDILIYAPAQKNSAPVNVQGWQSKRIGISTKQLTLDAHFAMLESLV